MNDHQHTQNQERNRESCPFLPPALQMLRPTDTRPLREKMNAGSDPGPYYLSTLTCAQSLWLTGKPAQSILQLNHALAVDIDADHPATLQWPLPYQAKVWIFTRRHEKGFIGNPTRHYQHLASRMSGPMKKLRSWRAWACFYLAEQILPNDDFPRDTRQIEKENLVIPTWQQIIAEITQLGIDGEADLLQRIYQM